jgi:hypothetical protein
MSVLVIGKFQGDTAKFRQALTDRAEAEPGSAVALGG